MVSRAAEQVKLERRLGRDNVDAASYLTGARAHGEVVVQIHCVHDEGAAGTETATPGQLRERRAPFRDPADLIETGDGDGLCASPDEEGNL
jgi:hypothetical protein